MLVSLRDRISDVWRCWQRQIGEDGQSYVWLDPMLTQVISGEYQVFYKDMRMRCFMSLNGQRSAFVVQGPPGAGFDWEVKAKQAGHEQERS